MRALSMICRRCPGYGTWPCCAHLSPCADREIDTDALALPGVVGILTGPDITEMMDPLVNAVRAPVAYYPIAVEKVRYAGEPLPWSQRKIGILPKTPPS